MTYDDDVREVALRPGLVWGFDFADGRALPVNDADLLRPDLPQRGFRWLHFNLADQRTLRWLASAQPVSPAATDLLLSTDTAQHGVAIGGALGLVLHDLEMDFVESEHRIGVLRIAVGPTMIVTARLHPVRCAEAVKQRIDAGAPVGGPGDALELIFTAMLDGHRKLNAELDAQVQAIEDELLRDRPSTDPRTFTTLRSLMVRLHRLFAGVRSVFRNLEEDANAPKALREAGTRFVARLSAIDAELLALQGQLRLLRDELDLQATQQTNENIYFLSILSALLLPATLVTGIFGMNTGGLLWTNHPWGSVLATGLALVSAGAVYLILRLSGFIRR
jgi:zinc transporter